jgi:formiminotetrahydrofolate cyclodeaminase
VLDFDDYLNRLASSAPTPGGGSAAALCGAMGASLVAMVARITRESPKQSERHPLADACIAEADALRVRFLEARTLDENAYGAVVAAMALPRLTDDEKTARTARLQDALAQAAAAPLAAVYLSVQLLALSERALDLENANLASDLGCAADFAGAAVDASALNVRVNHKYLKNAELVAQHARVLDEAEREAPRIAARVRDRVNAAIR